MAGKEEAANICGMKTNVTCANRILSVPLWDPDLPVTKPAWLRFRYFD